MKQGLISSKIVLSFLIEWNEKISSTAASASSGSKLAGTSRRVRSSSFCRSLFMEILLLLLLSTAPIAKSFNTIPLSYLSSSSSVRISDDDVGVFVHHQLYSRSCSAIRASLDNNNNNDRQIITTTTTTAKRQENWEKQYQKLKDFKEEFGHLFVDIKTNRKLYFWLHRQKRAWERLLVYQGKNNGDVVKYKETTTSWALPKLSEEQIDKLVEIGLGSYEEGPVNWKRYGQKEQKWNEMYQQLQEFKKINGHIQVPQGRKEYYNLYHWLSRQRRSWKLHNLSLRVEHDVSTNTNDPPQSIISKPTSTTINTIMTPERIEKLVAIGIEDEPTVGKKFDETRWDDMYQKLVKYKADFGTVKVSLVPGDKESLSLYNWVFRQKNLWRNSHNSNPTTEQEKDSATGINQDRIDKLVSVGLGSYENGPFEMDENFVGTQRSQQWDTMYQELVQFKEDHGHVDVPWKSNMQLYSWTLRQRKSWKYHVDNNSSKKNSTKMTPYRIDKLVEIGLGSYENGPYKYSDSWK